MRMISANNLTGDGIQMKTLEELVCSPTLTSGSQQPSIHLAVLNIFLSLTAILGNSLILASCPSQRIFASSVVETLVP